MCDLFKINDYDMYNCMIISYKHLNPLFFRFYFSVMDCTYFISFKF